MKKYKIAQIISGITFLLLAIFFSFSLIFALFNNGNYETGFFAFLIWTGQLIKSSYGLCSILIPLFFFSVAMVCLILQITFKTCIYISFSLVPFFTAVLSEKLYENSTKLTGAFGVVKLLFTIVITILLMAIEFLLSGIIAERISFNRKKKRQNKEELDLEKELFGEQKNQLTNEIYSNEFSKDNQNSSKIDLDEQEKSKSEYIDAFADIPLDEQKFDFQIEQEFVEEDENQNDDYNFNDEQDNYEEFAEYENDEIDIFEDEQISEPLSDNFEFEEEQQSDTLSDDSLFEESEELKNKQILNVDEQNFEDETNLNVDEQNFENETNFENKQILNVDEQNFEDKINFEDEQILNADEQNFEDETNLNVDEQTTESSADNFEIKKEQQDTEDFSEPEILENPVEETDGLSQIFSQMDAEIENRINKSTSQRPVTQKSVKEAEEEIKAEKKASISKKEGAYKIPTEGLLNPFVDQQYWVIDNKTNIAAAQLKGTLEEFKIAAEVTGIRKGPVVTMFEILPAPGVKLSKIVALQDNIALRLAASSVRIVAPIPGKRAVGIEVPNENRAIVTFRELIEQNLSEYKKMAIPVVLGKDIQGEAQLLDIAKTPHLLIAGSTGSGKSVCVNSIILSILYKRSPQEVKLILVDPKIVELKLYNDIPHLLTPVITEPKKALQSLQYCLCEMERRYALLDGLGVRDIINYNKRVEERHIATEKLPYIVVIIDEFADLMATTGKELESTIARLCAMSRAVGIHLVLATQRPSIDVITGLIKANIPSRIAFMVASKMDSRIIIDQVGAEKLLGRGDMLYASATDPFPVRIQGTYVSDQEVENVVEYVKGFGEPEYIDEEIFVETEEDEMTEPGLFGSTDDPLYNKALEIVMQSGKASASYLQRRLSIGYNRAARLIEDMEARGIVGPQNGSKPREIIHVP